MPIKFVRYGRVGCFLLLGCFFLFSACIDLNDFQKISKSPEVEFAVPFYSSSFALDTFLKTKTTSLKTDKFGVYYLEQQDTSSRYQKNTFDLGLDLKFQRLQVGPFLEVNGRLAVQQEFYDHGRYNGILSGSYSVTSITRGTETLNFQMRRIHISKGKLRIRSKNTFAKDARVVDLSFTSLKDVAGPLRLNYDLPKGSTTSDSVDISNYDFNLDAGTYGFNELGITGTVVIDDPSAQNNASGSRIGSYNRVEIYPEIVIESATSVEGSLPYYPIEVDRVISLKIPPLNDVTGYGSALQVLASILAFEVESHSTVPLIISVKDVVAHYADHTTQTLPTKKPNYLFEVSTPSVAQNRGTASHTPSLTTTRIMIDNSLVDEKVLREMLYDPKLDSISLRFSSYVSPAKASLHDVLKPFNLDFKMSVYAPMRVDVNNLAFQYTELDNANFITELKNVILQGDVSRVSRATFALEMTNVTPFDIYPQFYIYKGGVLTDSFISSEVHRQVKLEGAPIDYNGFLVNMDPRQSQTFLIDFDKPKWDRLLQADAVVAKLAFSSVKSAKVPYVYLKNDQHVDFKIDLQKLTFSPKVF